MEKKLIQMKMQILWAVNFYKLFEFIIFHYL